MRTVLFALVIAAGGTATPAVAQPTVEINFNPASQLILQQSLGLTSTQVQELVEDELRALYGLVDVPTFLRLSANAQSMTNRGLGVDYASDFEDLIIGVAATAAIDAGDSDVADFRALADGDTAREVPVSAGAQVGLMVGYRVLDFLEVYVNGLYYPLDIGDFRGTFYNVGAHVQYQALPGYGSRSLLWWGGLELTTGVELSRMDLELDDTFDASGRIAPGFVLDTESSGTLRLEQLAYTIPFEATTRVTMLYFLTLYGGLGLDIQFGNARMNVDLDSDLSTTDPNVGPLELGTAQIAVDDRGDPNRVMFRVLGGFQLNIWRLKIFGQLNFLTSDLTVGLAGGVRLVI